MENHTEKTSTKDFSDYYHGSIAASLEKIHLWNYEILGKPEILVDINMELIQIFKKIHRRLSPDERKFQEDLSKKLSSMRPYKVKEMHDRVSDRTTRTLIRSAQYEDYRDEVYNREVHIWDCLDRLGMTSKQAEKKKTLT